MAKQIEGVYDRVLECAKKEFLANGFNDASLRMIAKEANTSTGSIYTRFKDKDGLFNALVGDVVDVVHNMSMEIQEQFDKLDPKTQESNMQEYCLNSHKDIIDYIYDNKDIFYLLLNCSYGSSHEHFMDELILIEEKSTISFLKTVGREDLLNNPVVLDFVHILATSYCYGMFEPLLHNMSRERAFEFDNMFTKYHTTGFNALLNIK